MCFECFECFEAPHGLSSRHNFCQCFLLCTIVPSFVDRAQVAQAACLLLKQELKQHHPGRMVDSEPSTVRTTTYRDQTKHSQMMDGGTPRDEAASFALSAVPAALKHVSSQVDDLVQDRCFDMFCASFMMDTEMFTGDQPASCKQGHLLWHDVCISAQQG